MSTVFSAAGMYAGLREAGRFMGMPNTTWQIVPTSSMQVWLTEYGRWQALKSMVNALDESFVRASASEDVKVVNLALEAWGREIRLADIGGRGTFHFAAEVTLAHLYHFEGETGYLILGNKSYRVRQDCDLIRRVKIGDREGIVIETRAGYVYFIRHAPGQVCLSGPALIDHASEVLAGLTVDDRLVTGAVMPNVQFTEKPDIQALIGMNALGRTLVQALYECVLRMGPMGVVNISCMAGSMTRSGFGGMLHQALPTDFVLDTGFTVFAVSKSQPGFVQFAADVEVGNFLDRNVDVMAE